MNAFTNSSKNMPLVSVVLVTYNAEKYVSKAIESIVKQTFIHWECVIVDDGSSDCTFNLMQSLTHKDSRFKLYRKDHNYIASLNYAISKAKGKYIARMDSDDIMHPDRLRIQCGILEAESKVTLCASWIESFGEKNPIGTVYGGMRGVIEFPLLEFTQGNFIAHPTVMIRTSFLKEKNLSYGNHPYAEDFALWIDIAKQGGVFYIVDQVLLYYRVSDTQSSYIHQDKQRETATQLMVDTLSFLVKKNMKVVPECQELLDSFKRLQKKDLISQKKILRIVYDILKDNKNVMYLS